MLHSVGQNKIPIKNKCAEPLGEAVRPDKARYAPFLSNFLIANKNKTFNRTRRV